ncbi:MAG TPA: hypothetical protein VFY65_11920, partial [Longimicrobium sp.]|nr:hypothetical protein [Longimicrobium sp.]
MMTDEERPPHSAMTRRQAIGALAALAIPVHPSFDAKPGAAADHDLRILPLQEDAPDLGNLWDTVDWIARERAPSLSFLDPRWTSLEDWKAAARPAFHRHLAFDPAPSAVHGELVQVEEREGFRVEHVRIHASPAYTIPARVLVPSGARGRLSAVVALHCHGGQYAWGAAKLVSSPDDPPQLVEYRQR